MSSLSELKKELEDIKEVLVSKAVDLVDLEDKVYAKQSEVEALRNQKSKLERALLILEGKEPAGKPVLEDQEPALSGANRRKPRGRPKGSKNRPKLVEGPAETGRNTSDEPFVRNIPKPDPSMTCPACEGELVYTTKTVGSGKLINLKICTECSNEIYG